MEVTTIPDIRERNDRPKDKQPKHQAVSIVQRQMVCLKKNLSRYFHQSHYNFQIFQKLQAILMYQ